MSSRNGSYQAARHAVTALLHGADPTTVVIDSAAYGDWAPVLQRLAEAYAAGGTGAVVRSFDVLTQLDRNIAALVAGSPADESFDEAEVAIPALPAEAHVDATRAAEASPWLETYIAHSRRWSPRSFDDFHEAIGVWILSTIAARRVVVHLGKAQYTPLCIALAGRSSLHAKTTAAEIGLEVLHLAGLDWFLADDASTPQKFILDRTQRVPEDYDDLSPDAQQAVRRRLAFAGQCGWWYDEFGMLLHAMARSGSAMSDFSGLLRKFDDCAPHYSYGTISRQTDRIINPYVALLASLTPADLRPLMRRGSSGWSNGFWARWAFVTPPSDRYRTDRFPIGERTSPPALIWTLRAWHERLGVPEVALRDGVLQIGPLPTQVCTLASDVFEAYYRYNDALLALVTAAENEDLDSSYARLPIKALRVAALLASLENHGRLDARHWARGQLVAERWRASLHRIYGQTNGGEATDALNAEEAVLAVIERLGTPSVRDIKTRIAWLSRGEIQAVVEQLARIGLIDALPASRTVRYQLSRTDVP